MRAQKLARPTGRPVVAYGPTGGSTVDAREHTPEGMAYDPPVPRPRKVKPGGRNSVGRTLAAGVDGGRLYRLARAKALGRPLSSIDSEALRRYGGGRG